MKKALTRVWNWFGSVVITIWMYPAALLVALKDYIPHCIAWNVSGDEEYYENNIDYWATILTEKANRIFPKTWLEYWDEHA